MQFCDKILYLLNKRKRTQNQMIRNLNLGKNAMVHWRKDNNFPCAETLLKLSLKREKIYDSPLGNGKDKDYEQVIFKGNHNASIQS